MNIESLEFKLNIMAFRSRDHPDAVCIWRVKAWISRANQSSIWFVDISTAPCIKQPDLLACFSNFVRVVSLFFFSLCQAFKWYIKAQKNSFPLSEPPEEADFLSSHSRSRASLRPRSRNEGGSPSGKENILRPNLSLFTVYLHNFTFSLVTRGSEKRRTTARCLSR